MGRLLIANWLRNISWATNAGFLFVFKAYKLVYSRLHNCLCNTEDGQKDPFVAQVISCTLLKSKRFFFLLLTLISFNFAYSPELFAHAGVNHGDNCFVAIGGYQLRLGGFQSEEKIGGGKHYCHLFPATGKVIFTFEPEIIKQLHRQMNLKFFAVESYWDVLFDNENAFNQALAQTSDTASIQYNFPGIGLYALEINLEADNSPMASLESSQNNTQRFLFLVGLPIIKMLVFIAFGFLLLLGFIVLKQLKTEAMKT